MREAGKNIQISVLVFVLKQKLILLNQGSHNILSYSQIERICRFQSYRVAEATKFTLHELDTLKIDSEKNIWTGYTLVLFFYY